MVKKKIGSGLVTLGIFLALSGLIMFMRPYYTFAAPGEGCRASVSPSDLMFELENLNPGDRITESFLITNEGEWPFTFTIIMERVSGTPGPGKPGDLYDQLQMVVSHKGYELYNGPMSGFDSNLEDAPDLGAMIGEVPVDTMVQLDFTVYLPGRETSNEFQGSTLVTKIVVHVSCQTDDDEDDELIIDPEDPGINPELPRTGGFSHIYLTVIGLLLFLSGLILNRKSSITTK